MWSDLWAALALVLVLEGLMPFANPRRYRETMAAVAQFSDRNLRSIGFVSMLAGVLLLYWVRA